MIKTQHCPNCEATEQKLHDFRQKVSDVASVCAQHFCKNSWTVGDRQDHINMIAQFIIPKPKPDPLAEVVKGVTWYDCEITAKEIRAALDARGLEIREKNDD
jgi:hypothetical protein